MWIKCENKTNSQDRKENSEIQKETVQRMKMERNGRTKKAYKEQKIVIRVQILNTKFKETSKVFSLRLVSGGWYYSEGSPSVRYVYTVSRRYRSPRTLYQTTEFEVEQKKNGGNSFRCAFFLFNLFFSFHSFLSHSTCSVSAFTTSPNVFACFLFIFVFFCFKMKFK